MFYLNYRVLFKHSYFKVFTKITRFFDFVIDDIVIVIIR